MKMMGLGVDIDNMPFELGYWTGLAHEAQPTNLQQKVDSKVY